MEATLPDRPPPPPSAGHEVSHPEAAQTSGPGTATVTAWPAPVWDLTGLLRRDWHFNHLWAA